MKKELIIPLLWFSIKYGIFILILTSLFLLIPIDILAVITSPSFSPIPFDWACAASLLIIVFYFLPVLMGSVFLGVLILLYQRPFFQGGKVYVTGGVIGLIVFVLGTCLLFFVFKSDDDFLNMFQHWIFVITVLCWGTGIFSWLAHKMKIYISGERMNANTSKTAT